MKKSVEATYTKQVLTQLGGFAGLFELPTGYTNPVLVSGTDGVGTKLLLLQALDQMSDIGQDLVAMCVNDIMCQGGKPLFFLDYMAAGQLDPVKTAEVVDSIARACRLVDCALIGGETAEMPGLYQTGEFDLAGFCVGLVDKKDIITGQEIVEGDILLGLTSSGFHSNGYSLLRKLFLELYPERLTVYADRLIQPTSLYVKPVQAAMQAGQVKGAAHITGGGFYENIPRMLPDGLAFEIDTASWPADPMFDEVVALAELDQEESFSTFNMGIGMVLAVSPEQADAIIQAIQQTGQSVYRIGSVIVGSEGILT
ncbi:MAG: phosphoribosylformylglycinamidine cyclo-ligase, partial [Tissierellia bacterium]|nr:phosphoribosylformylglycinamidine cyclo-ligase [Tissierellia bacterium]